MSENGSVAGSVVGQNFVAEAMRLIELCRSEKQQCEAIEALRAIVAANAV